MKVLILINKVGLGDCIIHMNYIHEISKKYEKPVSILAKENTRAKDLFVVCRDNEDNNGAGVFIPLRCCYRFRVSLR